MDKFTIAHDIPAEIALEAGAPESSKEGGRKELRPLGDWELALVGGGENVPNW